MLLGRGTAIAHKAGLAAFAMQSIFEPVQAGRPRRARLGRAVPVGCCCATALGWAGGVAVGPIRVHAITAVSEVVASACGATSAPEPDAAQVAAGTVSV